jgi:hypothetical protein
LSGVPPCNQAWVNGIQEAVVSGGKRYTSRLGPSFDQPAQTKMRQPGGDNFRIIVEALILALFVRTFLFQPF